MCCSPQHQQVSFPMDAVDDQHIKSTPYSLSIAKHRGDLCHARMIKLWQDTLHFESACLAWHHTSRSLHADAPRSSDIA